MKRYSRIAALAAAITVGATLITSLAFGASMVIKGSDTMLIVVQAWTEAYMATHKNVDISVQGGGSGTGISALINGTTDICMASRPMKAKEIQQCKEKNIVPVATSVALDGVAIAVNKANPVRTLTMAQLKDIYTGKVTNWKSVGGNSAPIVVLSRESSSGTYVYFQDTVLGGKRYATTVLLMPSTKAIQQEVANNKNAIGYGGVAYFAGKKNIEVVSVAPADGKAAVAPTDDNVRSSKYPLSRPLLFYTAGKAKGNAAGFIQFCLSAEGQTIAEKVGYVALKK